MVSFSEDGKPDAKKAENTTFVLKDGVITIRTGKGGRGEAAGFTLDPSQTPAHIDLTFDKDAIRSGIYATKRTDLGLELTIAYADRADVARPKDFKGGKDIVMVKLLRNEEKK